MRKTPIYIFLIILLACFFLVSCESPEGDLSADKDQTALEIQGLEETKTLTTIIVIVTVAMAIFLGLLDFLFQEVMAGIIAGSLIQIGLAVVLFVGGAAAFYFNAQQD